MSFTPGPWKAGFDNGVIVAMTPDGDWMCAKTHDREEATSHLIAAAPDLYEALKALLDSNNEYRESTQEEKRGRAAIAKAEGK